MKIFISAGEPSGDLHGANLMRAIRRLHPNVEFVGFGGDRMEAAGCRLLYPLCQLAVMGLWQVIKHLPTFWGIVSLASRWLRRHRPDLVILIDYPGMHWWLAYRAKACGIPVVYFLPPQLWAWGPWRVARMRKYVDHCLCALPFEEKWYRDHGVAARDVGHPFFDELREQRLDAQFLLAERRRPGRVVALLPGSRTQEVEVNFPTLVNAAARIHAQCPDARFLVACFKSKHAALANQTLRHHQLPVEVHVGRTPEIMHLADAAIAVSGSVSLELMHHLTPTVIVYRLSRFMKFMARCLLTCKYVTLVNLLADEMLYPEYVSTRCEAEAAAKHVVLWLNDEPSRQALRDRLRILRDQVARPGACDRAARIIVEAMNAVPVRPARAA